MCLCIRPKACQEILRNDALRYGMIIARGYLARLMLYALPMPMCLARFLLESSIVMTLCVNA